MATHRQYIDFQGTYIMNAVHPFAPLVVDALTVRVLVDSRYKRLLPSIEPNTLKDDQRNHSNQ